MPADVARGDGTEQGIAQRVQRHVAVRMRDEPLRVRDAHAAERRRLRRPEAVRVIAMPDPHAGFPRRRER